MPRRAPPPAIPPALHRVLAADLERLAFLESVVVGASTRHHSLANALMASVLQSETLDRSSDLRLEEHRLEAHRKGLRRLVPLAELVRQELARAVPTDLERVPWRAVVEECSPGIPLELPAAPLPEWVLVSGGAPVLVAMLEALLANASAGDGTRAGTSVRFAARGQPDGGSVLLEVRDDGPGFPPHLLDGPPAPFRTTRPGAVGLGLFLCHRALARSGGSLERDNPPGGGARVTLRLPTRRAAS